MIRPSVHDPMLAHRADYEHFDELGEKNLMSYKTRLLTAAASVLVLASGSAFADDNYPTGPINIIVAYSAGGGTDVMARTMTPYLEEYLGGDVTVTVENRPGAGGEIGFTAVATAEPDGYTIGMLNSPAFLTPMIQRSPEYDLDSFQLIANVVTDAASIVVRADSEFETLDDFIAYARENPHALTVGNSAMGGALHTSLLRFLAMEDIEVTHVPFRGAAPDRTALLGGHTAASVMGLGEAGEYHAEGSLRILGTMAPERWSVVDDVPTFQELGYDIVSASDRGIAAPAGISETVLSRLAEAVENTVNDPRFREEAENQLLPLNYMGPDEYLAHVQDTFEDMQRLWETTPWAD
jgi:tripartite-type tricarboxylate transporter receptor subunit TctC